ncbi:MAG: pantoate--beta-alanine ligase, partial [Flavobacteriaceae bacterium]|nr:pantoate--beta-alanine ligase [Flavobacteriaceae bacterium]
MNVFYTTLSLQNELKKLAENKTIGLVPTMGALHKGHVSLIETAKAENDITVVSIFVNPTQFDKQEDLTNYPRTLESDLELLKNVKCDVVYVPSPEDIYNNNVISEKFDFDGLEKEMEGKHRKGHFDGVGTIVKKLFEAVKPTNAYFGEKDFQQLQIIKKLVEKYHIPVKVIGCEIYREKDGLAMSSRNLRLTEQQRKEAPFIYKTLKKAKQLFTEKSITEVKKWVEKEFAKNQILTLEYFDIANINTLKKKKKKGRKAKY